VIDILKALSVDVHCDQCGDFSIGADVIAESQRLLAEGCPGSPHECPPQLFGTLLPQSALESLRRAWDALEHATNGPVRQISLDDAPRVASRPKDALDPRTLARWEDDGGYIPNARKQNAAMGVTTSIREVEHDRP
jgi:hypothetical protein